MLPFRILPCETAATVSERAWQQNMKNGLVRVTAMITREAKTQMDLERARLSEENAGHVTYGKVISDALTKLHPKKTKLPPDNSHN